MVVVNVCTTLFDIKISEFFPHCVVMCYIWLPSQAV